MEPFDFDLRFILRQHTPDHFELLLASVDHERSIQDGYQSQQQVVTALIEAITTAAPDLTIVDEAMGKVAEALDAVRDIQDAMGSIADRLLTAEDAIRQLAGGGPANPLLAGGGRQPTRQAGDRGYVQQPPPRHQPPPPIRRLHNTPHVPTGGAFRPGQIGDPTADEGGEPEGDG